MSSNHFVTCRLIKPCSDVPLVHLASAWLSATRYQSGDWNANTLIRNQSKKYWKTGCCTEAIQAPPPLEYWRGAWRFLDIYIFVGKMGEINKWSQDMVEIQLTLRWKKIKAIIVMKKRTTFQFVLFWVEQPLPYLYKIRIWKLTSGAWERQTQRPSQVSLAGGLAEFRGGGEINLNTYSYGKRDRQPRGGGSNFSRGDEPPTVATGLDKPC